MLRDIVKSSIPRSVKQALYPWVVRGGMITYPMRLMPDFIVFGVARCGTTNLYLNLTRHPNIRPALRKEIHFFDGNYDKGLGWYRTHFPTRLYKRYMKQIHNQNIVTGEASPYYIFHPHVPKRIFDVVPHVKLIAMLRNPIDRSYSQHQRGVRKGKETLSFEEAIEKEMEALSDKERMRREDEKYQNTIHRRYIYLARGMYADQLQPWVDLFPREQLLILQSEAYFTDRPATLNRIAQFLGQSSWTLKRIEKPDSSGYSYPKMNPETRKRLIEYYEPYNQRLYDLIGEDFGWD